MNFSISNLLLAMLAISVALGWYIDRSSLNRKYERDIVITHAVDRVQAKARLWATFSTADLDKDFELYEIIDRRDEGAERFLNLMSIYQSRDSVSDPVLAKSFTQASMQQLGCKDIDDLRRLIAMAKWDVRIAIEDGSEESTEFEEYLKQAMRPLY